MTTQTLNITNKAQERMDQGIEIVREEIKRHDFNLVLTNPAMAGIPKTMEDYNKTIKELVFLEAETVDVDREYVGKGYLKNRTDEIKSGFIEEVDQKAENTLKYNIADKAIKIAGAIGYGITGFVLGSVANQCGAPEEAIYATAAIGAIGGYLGAGLNEFITKLDKSPLRPAPRRITDLNVSGDFDLSPIVNAVKNVFSGNNKSLESNLIDSGKQK